MRTEQINAVHSDDLERFLADLRVLDDVIAGNCRCRICGRVVTVECIAALYPENRQVMFVCDDTGCLDAVIRSRR